MDKTYYGEHNGKPILKLHGHGMCTCKGCADKGLGTGAWCWTSGCYEYDGKIYCYYCLQNIIKGGNK